MDSELVVIKTRLENFEKEIEELVRKKKQSKEYQDEASSCIGKVKEELDDTPRYRRRKLLGRYGKDLGFLSQQIDERSHQIWTLGALFVPISFLIFAQTVTLMGGLDVTTLVWRFLLEIASFICYGAWFHVYRRAHRFNVLSYPRIHTLEKTLGCSGHLYLGDLRNRYGISTSPPRMFKWTFGLLALLWTIYILSPMIVLLNFIALIGTGVFQAFIVIMLIGSLDDP